MNRITRKFQDNHKARKKTFIAFITAGDPNLKTSEALALEFENAGVDILELGVPFSDPMADGPTIQASSQRALKNKVSLKQILDLVKRIRTRSQLPIALMPYYNSVFHYGVERFVRDAKAAGVDGVIIPDLPPEEAEELTKRARKADLCTIFLAAPTTRLARLPKIIKAATGFIYYVSLTGVTGARTSLPNEIRGNVRRIKSLAKTPVCVGFGISTPAHVKDIGRIADGVIVGSAIVKTIEHNLGKTNLLSNVTRYVKSLVNALD